MNREKRECKRGGKVKETGKQNEKQEMRCEK
jgi:hypothetical protein